jgi:uncharacterized protein (TIGR02284 family)
MSTYTEEVGTKLNGILEKNYDAEKGFKKAAENAKSTNLKAYFRRKSDERNQFGHDMKTEIRKFGEDVDKGGSTTGAAHRTWMDVKAFFSMDNDESMLEAAITGEKAAADEYRDVLKDTSLPASTANLLRNQLATIESELSTIKKLEDLA